EMPADPREVEDALAEGVEIAYLAAPVRALHEDGRMTGIECIRMELGAPDESGRRRPVPVEGSEFVIEADTLIPAVSQSADGRLAELFGLKTTRWQTIEANEITMETGREGFFAGGDVVLGPSSVIEAIDHGKRAGQAIANHLSGRPIGAGLRPRERRENPLAVEKIESLKERTPHAARIRPLELPPETRRSTFDEVEAVYTEEEARAEAARCLNCADCCECLECVNVCQANAINHLMGDEEITLDIGAVILSPGIEGFMAEGKEEYGFGHIANVVTSIQYERILSASGPFGGHVVRPSDHREPRRIAFLQCIGSRDLRCDREHCSSVCCTYATKEAILTRDHCPEAEITIFGMDFRTHGKGFERFMIRAQRECGVRYIRSRVPAVDEDPETHNLWLTFESESGETIEEEFDLVVLSVGLEVPKRVREMAVRLGIEIEQSGFARTAEDQPLVTTRPGVFVCGAFESPKDIPETVMQASAAAALAAGQLSDARGTMITVREYPPERDVSAEDPRVGVFVCSCGSNIAGTVDVKTVTATAGSMPGVVWSENLLYTCSQDALGKIRERIQEHGLNRVVVASCTPRTHERLFQDNLREAGLNRHLFQMANIREHCSWVTEDPARATEKATALVSAAVHRVVLHEALVPQVVDVEPSALVIGGGVAGMNAALAIADQGFDVTIVEKCPELGGLARRIHHTLSELDVAAYLRRLESMIAEHPRITTLLGSTVRSVGGSVGQFKSVVETPEGEREISHGVIVVATGGREIETREYAHGSHPGIMTQMAFEERITGGESLEGIDRVVMIQCVGSRTEENPNCSRICCAEAVKNAITLKRQRPEARVTVLYRDVRTYGLMERHYREARELGVLFVHWEPEQPPEVQVNGSLRVRYRDPILGRDIVQEADVVALSVGVCPGEDNEVLAPMLRVPLTIDGTFLEAHVKLRPVDFSTEGIFLCGLAHGPKLISEAAMQGLAAGARAGTILSHGTMETLSIVSEVDPDHCSGCRLCNALCPYQAITYLAEERVSSINATMCKGCGTCVAACPSGAILGAGFTDEQLFAEMRGILVQ
ncbi:FAD-dependent oxidoreductase, partial [Candidatus Sumerlaeota bacterium]|nr:FAD-dependent oxidoreductase [Candidatus Sumerlaeota bacterium]